MSELRTRSITGIGIVAVIAGLTIAGQLPTQILVLVICGGCSYELITLSAPESGLLLKTTFVVFTILPVGWIILQMGQESYVSVLPEAFTMWSLPLLFGLYGLVVIASGTPKPFELMSSMAIAVLLFTGGGIFAMDVISIAPIIVLGVFILLWSNDVFAYLTGSKFGKTKLAPTISPGKTWEGVAGGAIMCIATSLLLSEWITELSMINWIVLSVLVVIFGTMGDLLQSTVKRHFNAKDSGNILPGHGGIWDRFDSFFGCVAFISIYLMQAVA